MNGMSDAKEVKGFRRLSYLPRLGKIRLGVIVPNKTGITKDCKHKAGEYCYLCSHPKEVDYFVVPPEVAKVYGEKPILLDIILPSDDQHTIIPFSYKKYGANQKLQCKGDGEVGTAFNFKTGEITEKECPCEELENKDCSLRGHFMVILPRISLGGVYQIDIGSVVNLNRILNVIDYYKSIAGRIKGIPLTLERVPEKMADKQGKMQTHYLFRFGTMLNIEALNLAIEKKDHFLAMEYKVEAPKEEGKLSDTPVIEEGEITDEEKEKKKKEIPQEEGRLSDTPEIPKKEKHPAEQWKEILDFAKEIKKANPDFNFKKVVSMYFPGKEKGSDFTEEQMKALLTILRSQYTTF